MALAILVTLEKEIPELATYTKTGTGKALAREIERLETPARAKKVQSITALLSESQAALIEQMKEQGMDPTKMRLPPEQWFDAGEGLKTVRGLSEYVSENLNNFKQPNPILRDLKAAEGLLAGAQSAGVRFHFTKTNI